eukprot:SAG31_NODE_5416_length_2550_cov_1.080375_2_plen_86_part_00
MIFANRYQEAYEAVRKAGAADIGIGIADTGSDAMYSSDSHLPRAIQSWLRSADHLFYAWHCYSCNATRSVENAVAIAKLWCDAKQ